jgi:Tol biopolymer transport system component
MEKRLLHYEILHRIGKGGMGDVYAAEDTKLGRTVALKILPPEMAADPERRARFEREARAVAALNHPNIVTIHSVEEADGVHFITMELVEGKTLSELIPKGGSELAQFLDRAVALTDAVSAAHKRGITHRDLKPDNVMLSDDGRVKVLDFGLAKLRGAATDDAAATRLAGHEQTAEGKILGTVAYMSPEQAEGKAVDPRSDVFSLGIILYEMATGQRPFKGDTPISTVSSILRDTPTAVTELKASLPRHLGRIVKRCLAKDPDRRYQTAVDLRNDLEGLKEEIESGEILLERPGASVGAGGFRGRRLVLGIAVLAVAVVGVSYGVYGLVGLGAGEPGTTAPFQQMEMTRLTSKQGGPWNPAVSPDGKYVVYVQDDGGRDSLWLLQTGTARSVQIVPTSGAGIWGPSFSPDGDLIYYVSRVGDADPGTLYRVPVLGGPSTRVLEDVDGRISFSPDGSQFVFLRTEGVQRYMLVVADADGRNEHVIASRTSPDEYHRAPAWSPDGSVVAVAALTRADGDEYSLVVVPSEGGTERTISSRTWGHIDNPAWLPDGSGLVVTESFQLWEQPYPEGTARRITNDLNSYSAVSLAADGQSLVTQVMERQQTLWVTSVGESGEPQQITSGDLRVHSRGVSWTRDGRIVYGVRSGQSVDLWITGVGGGKATQLTFGGADTHPSVSSDGRYVVFNSRPPSERHIWRIGLDGGDPVQLTFGEGERLPQCHPEGRWVLYLGDTPDGDALYRVPIEGGEPELLSEMILARTSPAISPDGEMVAVQVGDESTDETLTGILRIEGGEPVRTLGLDTSAYRSSLRWSPDGDALDYVDVKGGVGNIWSRPLDGGPPRQLTHFEDKYIDDFAWAPDGKTVAAIRRNHTWSVVLLKNFR